jgi:hypothetical protein
MEHRKSNSIGAANDFDHLVEPPYDLKRGAELNERAGEHDPAFKKKMEEGRKAAEKVAPKT